MNTFSLAWKMHCQEIRQAYKENANIWSELIAKVMYVKTGSNLDKMEKESILELLKRIK